MGGWFDVFLQGTLNNFMGVKKQGMEPGRSNQKVVIGPWIHNLGVAGTETVTGAVDFSDTAKIDLMNEHLRWFDYWLKGIDNGVTDEPPVRVFVMGANEWKTASDWPIPGTEYTPYYLHSDGSANSLFGDGTLDTSAPGTESPDEFVYDPNHPVMTVGGSTCCLEELTPVSMGPHDQQQVEWRPDVLVYTTPPLEAGRRGHRAGEHDAVRGVGRAGYGLHREARGRLLRRTSRSTSHRASSAPDTGTRGRSRRCWSRVRSTSTTSICGRPATGS